MVTGRHNRLLGIVGGEVGSTVLCCLGQMVRGLSLV